jgi:hypothetical protein
VYGVYMVRLLEDFGIELENNYILHTNPLKRYEELKKQGFIIDIPRITISSDMTGDDSLPCALTCTVVHTDSRTSFGIESKFGDITNWVNTQYPIQFPAYQRTVLIQPYKKPHFVVKTHVYNNTIHQQITGSGVPLTDVKVIYEAARRVVECVSKFKDTTGLWLCYSFDMSLCNLYPSEPTFAYISRIGGWETEYQTPHNNNLRSFDLQIGGYVAIGGNKLVTSGTYRTLQMSRRVAICQIRNPNMDNQIKTFRNDIVINNFIQKQCPMGSSDWCVRLVYSDLRQYGWAMMDWYQHDLREISNRTDIPFSKPLYYFCLFIFCLLCLVYLYIAYAYV